MTKHFIRLNEHSEVVHGYSTDFEEVEEGDICINEDAPRHFEIDGVVNPSIFFSYLPVYKFVNGALIKIQT